MSRIIAGAAGGRRLRMPPGRATRPTSERAREGLFSTLTSLVGELAGVAFLDLYAGSGAVGLEAASRGAARTLLVESDPRALAALRHNVAELALPGVAVRGLAVQGLLAGPADAGAFDVVFADPPYAAPVDALLATLAGSDWLATGGLVALERAARDPAPAWPPGLQPLRCRRYGEAMLWYGRRS